MMDLLSPRDVMRMGLGYAGIGHTKQKKLSTKQAHDEFKAHFGSSALVVATIWYDLCHTTIEEAKLSPKESSLSGFKRYMLGHFFVWTYPKNRKLLKSRFGICDRYLEGAELWHWPKKIAALKAAKIVWPKQLQSSESAIIDFEVGFEMRSKPVYFDCIMLGSWSNPAWFHVREL